MYYNILLDTLPFSPVLLELLERGFAKDLCKDTSEFSIKWESGFLDFSIRMN